MKKLLLTLTLLSSSTMANAITYNELKKISPDQPGIAFQVYALGVIDESILLGGFCPPEGTPYDQSIAIAKKFIDEHPEMWGYEANLLISVPLARTFPCPPKTKTSTDPKF
jgi:hypothetical protein